MLLHRQLLKAVLVQLQRLFVFLLFVLVISEILVQFAVHIWLQEAEIGARLFFWRL